MKKIIALVLLIITIYILIGNSFSNKIIIPEEAIRVRVIANSNTEYDQSIKKEVKEVLKIDFINMFKSINNINDFRKELVSNLSIITNDIKELLDKYNMDFDINYGLNYFPKKEFKDIVYDEGYYESLVVTLGSGLGDNWWCVLFPPLCMIEASESSNIEYTTLVRELINKYF